MCGCSSFTGNRPSEITTDEFTGNRPSYITSDFDGETDVFANFFTKKQRDRRKKIKEGMESGLSKDEARKQALASLPRTKLSELIEKIKNGDNINVIQTPLGDITLDTKIDEKLNELSNALKDSDVNATDVEPTFFEKNKIYIIGGAVLIAGIVIYTKFIKK